MSVLTLEHDQIDSGFLKGINAGAMKLLFNNLQKDQYQYPQKSMIREITSNGIDAIAEKKMAINILTGVKKASDYFVPDDGTDPELADSKFDPDYYDLKWLSQDQNEVVISYHEVSTTKDYIEIKDYGVGLGPKRLKGYFELGYSTKRLSNFGIGKFGLGSKSPLATNVAAFITESRYNGMLFRFLVYSFKAESIIPAQQIDGTPNQFIELPAPTVEDPNNVIRCYWEPTTEMNGVTIRVDTKKHHKDLYTDAAKNQLLYFPGVRYQIFEHTGRLTEVPIKADILYEDDYIVMSNNMQYSKPHLVINRVNYGYVDFKELEMEDRLGNVGIKVSGDEVAVSSSREHVNWNEITRETVLKRFKQVVGIAEKILEGELTETDFMAWVKTCASIHSSFSREGDNTTLVGRLAKLVDLNHIQMRYKPDPEFRYSPKLFAGLDVKLITLDKELKGGNTTLKVNRKEVNFDKIAAGDYEVVVLRGRSSPRKDRYMLDNLYQDGFVALKLTIFDNDESDEEEDLDATVDINKIPQAKYDVLRQLYGDPDTIAARLQKLRKYILESEEVTHYDAIQVPDSYSYRESKAGEEEDEVEMESEEQKADFISARQRRKAQGLTILGTPTYNGFHRKEIELSTISEWTNQEIFYGFGNEFDGKLIEFVTNLIKFDEGKYLRFYDDNKYLRLIRIAQENKKYYTDFRHIRRFFIDIKKGVLTMSSALIRWNTARYLHQHLPKVAFLKNASVIHPAHAKIYARLVEFCEEWFLPLSLTSDKQSNWNVRGEEYQNMIKHVDKVAELQLFVQQNPDADEATVGKLAKQMFGVVKNNYGHEIPVTDGCALDMNIYNEMNMLLEHWDAATVMLNMNYKLAGPFEEDQEIYPTFTEAEETALREFITNKNITL